MNNGQAWTLKDRFIIKDIHIGPLNTGTYHSEIFMTACELEQ